MRGLKVKGIWGSVKEPIIIKETASECWECISHAKSKSGHVRMRLGNKSTFMHRFFYEYYRGPIPDGMCVCHHCDNPACVNPDHLFITTSTGNTADRHKKGRSARGSQIGTSVLTETEAIEILESEDSGLMLAQKYGVSRSCISAIRRGHSWKHLRMAT